MTPTPAPGVSFHPIDGGGIVFSAADQRLYAFDPVAGLCWLSLDAAEPEREAVAMLGELTGIGAAEAGAWFRSCLGQFGALGLLAGSEKPPEAPVWPDYAMIPAATTAGPAADIRCRLPGLEVALAIPQALQDRLAAMLSATRVAPGAGQADAAIAIIPEAGGFAIRSGDVALGHAPDAESVAVTLENILVNLSVRRTPHLVALHAALLARGGQGVLLSGPSGAGKSTLVSGLLAQGWDYGTDELVMLTAAGMVPMPIAPCIKEGSIAEVAGNFPALAREPVQERYGRRVRYLPLPRPALAQAVATCVVFPTWDAAATPALQRLSGLEGLTRLLAQCIRVPGRMDTDGVGQLLAWHRGAAYFAMTYAGTRQATQLLDAALRG